MPRITLVWVCLMLLAFMPVLAQDDALEITEIAVIDTIPIRDFLSVRNVAAWSPDSRILAFASRDRAVELWDAETGEQLAMIQAPFAQALAFSPDGELLAVGGPITLVMRVEIILEWGTLAQDDFGPASQDGLLHAVIPIEGRGDMAALGFAGNEALLTYQAMPFIIKLWDISEPVNIPNLASPSDIQPPASIDLTLPDSVSLDPYAIESRSDGLYGVMVDRREDPPIVSVQRIIPDFDAETVNLEPYGESIEIDTSVTPFLSLSSDLEMLRAAGGGSLQLFDIEAGTAAGAHTNEGDVMPVSSPDGAFIVESSAESPLEFAILDLETGSPVAAYSFDGPAMRNSFLFSPDGSKLMVVADNAVQILGLSGAGIATTAEVTQAEQPTEQTSATGGCAIDLSETIALLDDAQAAADEGDAAQAIDLMAEASANLEALSAECQVVETSDIDLSQSLTLETDFGSLSFDYPGDWLTQEFDENAIVLGNRASAFELDLRTSEPSPVELGNVLMLVGAVDLDYYGQTSLGKNASPAQVLEALAGATEGVFTTEGDPVEFVANDRPAASLVMHGDGLALNFTLVKLAVGTDSPIFGQAVLITAPDELAAYEPTLRAVVESFRLEPV